MKRYNAWLRPAGALVILLILLALATLQTGQAVPPGVAPVFVTNTGSSQAVPVSYPTTPTVNVGTLPSVTVGSLPSITGSVSISGTPTVGLAAGSTVGINGSVQVGNTATSPVLVRDVDNPAKTPFEAVLCDAISSTFCTTSGLSNSLTVPSTVGGKTVNRLVIEYVSANCGVSPTTGQVALFLLTSTSNLFYNFPVANVGPAFVGNQLTRIYAAPGATLTITQGASGVTTDSCRVAISGYLVTE